MAVGLGLLGDRIQGRNPVSLSLNGALIPPAEAGTGGLQARALRNSSEQMPASGPDPQSRNQSTKASGQ